MADARITIEGGIVTDPRWNTTQSGHRVGNLTVRAGRSRKEQDGSFTTLSSTAYDVAHWDLVHDLLAAQTPEKGQQVTITGTVAGVEIYTDRDGNTQATVKVNAEGVRVWPKRQQQGGSYGAPQGQSGYGQPQGGYGQQGPGNAPQGGGYGTDDPPF
ncbi:hypothetical protein GCM10009592_14340 [Brachybacterium rhamnosum]|uniref:Single-stranded DNA-binding protein n=1 Tax=Brachybacterium rhamnosum TaxID=173361 RepID=A0ABW4PWB2_9MICO